MTDYIEREAAIKAISTAMEKVDRKIMRDRLMSIPAADVVPAGAYNQAAWERDTAIEQLKQIGKNFGEQMDDVRPVVRGKWMFEGSIENTYKVFTCSQCGANCIDGGNFCPNCGADMREES